MAQLVKHRLLISAQVMISPFVGESPISGSVLIEQNLLGISLSPSFSFPPVCTLSLSNKHLKK